MRGRRVEDRLDRIEEALRHLLAAVEGQRASQGPTAATDPPEAAEHQEESTTAGVDALAWMDRNYPLAQADRATEEEHE